MEPLSLILVALLVVMVIYFMPRGQAEPNIMITMLLIFIIIVVAFRGVR